MAANDGKIQLALRNTVDSKKNDPPTILQADVFTSSGSRLLKTQQHTGTGKKSAAPPPPPAPYVIEVITGNKRENKSFPNTTEKH
jgi:hypothetical protein